MQASVSECIRLDKHFVFISTNVLVARHPIHSCNDSFKSKNVEVLVLENVTGE